MFAAPGTLNKSGAHSNPGARSASVATTPAIFNAPAMLLYNSLYILIYLPITARGSFDA